MTAAERGADPAAADAEATPVNRLDGGSGLSRIDPTDPAAPNYRLLAALRTPPSLREIMIAPAPSGYIGKDHPVDPSLLPPSGALLYPPAFIAVGPHDPMIDGADAFGQALRDAGNPFVELFVRDGMPHGFYFFPTCPSRKRTPTRRSAGSSTTI